MSRNRCLAQDMWRLEDKVEGSERFTRSRESERAREKFLGLDGNLARDDHDEEEKGERDLSAMPRTTAATARFPTATHPPGEICMCAWSLTKPTSKRRNRGKFRLVDHQVVHTPFMFKEKITCTWVVALFSCSTGALSPLTGAVNGLKP